MYSCRGLKRNRVAGLDDPAVFHHAVLRHLAHDTEVMGNQQDRHAPALLDVAQQGENCA